MAAHHLAAGDRVRVVDDLSRSGTELNWQWLETLDGNLQRLKMDVRDPEALLPATEGCDVVYHLAAQVAVTTSVTDPRTDFEVNAFGTFNVLEAVRRVSPKAILLFASTNKVYGGMEDIEVGLNDGRYAYRDLTRGVPESMPLDFHSPYGCSKGAGDQYVRDYARIYGLRTVVFRQSCIYGTRQFGNEDQGWVAHFARQAAMGKPITIYGDGRQVRDLLWIGDLVDCYQRAIARIDDVAGGVFNIGGGPERVASLLDVISALERLLGRRIETRFDDWRPGDQRVYVSDISRAEARFGWRPVVQVDEGIRRLMEWIASLPK